MLKKDSFMDFFLYLIVGGIATLVEWLVFYLLDSVSGCYYIISTIIAYIISTFTNWLAGKMILFKETKKGMIYEILSVYGASIIGLILNMLIMWIMVSLLSVNAMVSKIVATCLVFMWNFLIRKLVIYK